jgi:hypothetical protein
MAAATKALNNGAGRLEKAPPTQAMLWNCAWQQAIGGAFLLVGKRRIKLLGGI